MPAKAVPLSWSVLVASVFGARGFPLTGSVSLLVLEPHTVMCPRPCDPVPDTVGFMCLNTIQRTLEHLIGCSSSGASQSRISHVGRSSKPSPV